MSWGSRREGRQAGTGYFADFVLVEVWPPGRTCRFFSLIEYKNSRARDTSYGAVNHRLRPPLARVGRDLPLPKLFKRAILARNRRASGECRLNRQRREAMTLPGFNAEMSLYKSTAHYRLITASAQSGGVELQQQLPHCDQNCLDNCLLRCPSCGRSFHSAKFFWHSARPNSLPQSLPLPVYNDRLQDAGASIRYTRPAAQYPVCRT